MNLCWVPWCDHVRIKIIIIIIINFITAVYFMECITNFILYTTYCIIVMHICDLHRKVIFCLQFGSLPVAF